MPCTVLMNSNQTLRALCSSNNMEMKFNQDFDQANGDIEESDWNIKKDILAVLLLSIQVFNSSFIFCDRLSSKLYKSKRFKAMK